MLIGFGESMRARYTALAIKRMSSINNTEEIQHVGGVLLPTTEDQTQITQFSETTGLPAEKLYDDGISTLGKVSGTELGDWFSRPVKIGEFSTSNGTSLVINFDPYSQYFSKESIKNKLKGYSRIRMSLKLKFTINASPFQYGAWLVSYKPMAIGGSSGTMKDGSGFPMIDHYFPVEQGDFSGSEVQFTATTDQQLMARSLRQNIILYPASSEGGELALPFIWHKNWVDVFDNDGYYRFRGPSGLGCITLQDMAVMKSANPTATAPANISIFAWCDDIELAGPSIALQSGGSGKVVKKGEFDGVVSKTATCVAGVAKAMSFVPFLAPMAKATEMVAKTVAGIANMFGFSPTPIMQAIQSYRLALNPNLCTTDDPTNLTVLAMDHRNELSIDPRIIGLSGEDEMTYSYINSREAYIGSTTWNSADTSNTNLLRLQVTPMAHLDGTTLGEQGGTINLVQMSPSCHLGLVHRYWTGTIKYRFQVIASQYHRGRIRIRFDPSGLETKDDVLQINSVFDISVDSNISFEAPYMATTGWLETDPDATFLPGTTFAARGGALGAFNSESQSGLITIEVLNELGSPDYTSDVTILVYMDCTNVRFALPQAIPNLSMQLGGSMFTLQSLSTADDAPDPRYESVAPIPCTTAMNDGSMYMGEVLTNIRSLMHRSTLYDVLQTQLLPAPATDVDALNYIAAFWRVIYARYPTKRGTTKLTTSAGVLSLQHNAAVANLTSSNVQVQYEDVNQTFLNWFSSCYIGNRGSIVWRFVPSVTGMASVPNTSICKVSANAITNGYAYYGPMPTDRYLYTDSNSNGQNDPNRTMDGRKNAFAGVAPGDQPPAGVANLKLSPGIPTGTGMCNAPGQNDFVSAASMPMYTKHKMLSCNMLNYPFPVVPEHIRAYGMPDADSFIYKQSAVPFKDFSDWSLMATDVYMSAGFDYTTMGYQGPPTMSWASGRLNVPG